MSREFTRLQGGCYHSSLHSKTPCVNGNNSLSCSVTNKACIIAPPLQTCEFLRHWLICIAQQKHSSGSDVKMPYFKILFCRNEISLERKMKVRSCIKDGTCLSRGFTRIARGWIFHNLEKRAFCNLWIFWSRNLYSLHRLQLFFYLTKNNFTWQVIRRNIDNSVHVLWWR